MKRLFFVFAFFVAAVAANAQNVQTHYDMGDGRGYLTTTVEMFKPDKMGSTFFFIDMDYGSNDVDGVSSAYWEIARSFKVFGESAFEPRVEYNGGLVRLNNEVTIAINNAYLIGGQYTWNNADFSRVFTLQANYKHIQDKDAGFQITGVWGMHFFNRKLSFTGFADFWKEDNMVFDDEGNMSEAEYVFLTEPQIWYNACEHFSFGGEVEISSNFSGNDGFMVNPTLAVKWTF